MKMKHHNSNDKRPQPHGIAPREHYVYKARWGCYKPKKPFDDEMTARNWAKFHYRDPWNIVVYRCSVCGKFHISTHKINDKTK